MKSTCKNYINRTFAKMENMKVRGLLLIMIAVVFTSCKDNSEQEEKNVHKVDWSENTPSNQNFKSYPSKYTYLPIYSEVYALSDEETRNVTATVSIHNMNLKDTLYVQKADYYNSEGELVRSYVEDPIFLRPMETADIVIHELDNKGGTGANFLIEWKQNDSLFNPPLCEGVMISTNGQQGLSFTTRGVIMNAPSE